jgi:hypothetical protein
MQIGAIIDLYIQHLPLTIRQIYYRLVAEYNYPKTVQRCDNLVGWMTKARRAQWYVENPALRDRQRLLFACIRDDKATVEEPLFCDDADAFFERVKGRAKVLRLAPATLSAPPPRAIV